MKEVVEMLRYQCAVHAVHGDAWIKTCAVTVAVAMRIKLSDRFMSTCHPIRHTFYSATMTKIIIIFNKQQHALDVDVRDSVEVVRLMICFEPKASLRKMHEYNP